MNRTKAAVNRRERVRRCIVLAGVYAMVAAVGLAALNLRAGAQASTPGAVSPANQAAAELQFQKAKALYDSGKFAEAQVENEKALALDPTHSNAILLRRVLAGKIGAGGAAPAAATTQGGAAPVAGHANVLNAQQISMIRLAEWSGNDRNIRGHIDRKVLDQFWQEVISNDPTANQSQQAHDLFVNPANFPVQAARIWASGDMRFISQIQVTADPGSMLQFQRQVQPYVLKNCATSECHGGEKGGNFRLILAAGTGPGAITAEQQIYTNFYIMAMYTGREGGKMLDRDNPDRSLLVQYDLPKNVAATAHPKVDVPQKINVGDARYRGVIEWIRTLSFPRPNYGITFELPGGGGAPASQPATSTKPATTAK